MTNIPKVIIKRSPTGSARVRALRRLRDRQARKTAVTRPPTNTALVIEACNKLEVPDLAPDSVVVGMASIPERVTGLEKTIRTFIPQCDKIIVCLNNYNQYLSSCSSTRRLW